MHEMGKAMAAFGLLLVILGVLVLLTAGSDMPLERFRFKYKRRNSSQGGFFEEKATWHRASWVRPLWFRRSPQVSGR
jgi:hypothetical protein